MRIQKQENGNLIKIQSDSTVLMFIRCLIKHKLYFNVTHFHTVIANKFYKVQVVGSFHLR